MRAIIAIALLTRSVLAPAVEIEVSFKPPTEYIDNSPLAEKDIAAYKYFYISATDGKKVVGEVGATVGMRSITLNVGFDLYAICLYTKMKTGLYSPTYSCTIVNTQFPTTPSNLCRSK